MMPVSCWAMGDNKRTQARSGLTVQVHHPTGPSTREDPDVNSSRIGIGSIQEEPSVITGEARYQA